MKSTDSNDVADKLVLLFMIEKIDMPVSTLQLMKIVLDNKFMNYFSFQQILNEISENKLVENHTNGSSNFFLITESGKKSLEYFKERIPLGIATYIENNINTIRSAVKQDTSIHTEIIQESDNQFVCVCRIQEENFSLLDVKISVGTKSDAQIIINNWRTNPQTIYEEVLQSMLKSRN